MNNKLRKLLGSNNLVNQNLGITIAKSLGKTSKEIAIIILSLGKKFYTVTLENSGYMWTRVFKKLHIDIFDDDDGEVIIELQECKKIEEDTKTIHSFNNDNKENFDKIIKRIEREIDS